MPPELGPSRHSDLSSVSSPPARTSPHGDLDVQPAQNQLNVPPAETTRSERIDVGNADRVTMASQTEPMREDQEIQAKPTIHIDTEPQSNNLEKMKRMWILYHLYP